MTDEMYRNQFPKCPVEGPIEPPVPFGHLGLRGAVPQKCITCCNLFEGDCTRYMDEVGHYMELDHGDCGISGPTDPIIYDAWGDSGTEIPRKCVSCKFLKTGNLYGPYCSKDEDKWGHLRREFDWGTWEPDFISISLPMDKVTTRELVRQARDNNLLEFVKEYRRVNPKISIQEARNDFQEMRPILEKWSPKK